MRLKPWLTLLLSSVMMVLGGCASQEPEQADSFWEICSGSGALIGGLAGAAVAGPAGALIIAGVNSSLGCYIATGPVVGAPIERPVDCPFGDCQETMVADADTEELILPGRPTIAMAAPAVDAVAPVVTASDSLETSAEGPILGTIYFDANSSELRSRDEAKLRAYAKFIKSTGNYAIVLHGYSDDDGSVAKNLLLSKKRAETVREYLEGERILDGDMAVKFYGNRNPLTPGGGEDTRALNRRVVLRLVR
ncbi:OmpA family protein [Aestuariirhabdus sp. LZHN29]|uniref:OmpA family protein n=1 Tax=Aestuariirhabdus sp. LZHN29 TaxID=3417462 RepID=UPI003CF82B7E